MATETEPMPPDFDEATAWAMIQQLRADKAATVAQRSALETEKADALDQLEAARAQLPRTARRPRDSRRRAPR